jgi:hypothetical protein
MKMFAVGQCTFAVVLMVLVAVNFKETESAAGGKSELLSQNHVSCNFQYSNKY